MTTAEEFLSDEIDRTAFPLIDNWLEDNNQEGQTLKDVLVKFAKLHVEAALKEASKKAEAKVGAGERSFLYVDENSILNAYPLNLIK